MGILSVAVSDFSYPDEQRVDQLREEFVARFPVNKLPSLKLHEYALGVDAKENTFCWWLEFKTSDVGRIGGPTAMKHGIYFNRDEQKWKYDSRYTSKEEASDMKTSFTESSRGSEPMAGQPSTLNRDSSFDSAKMRFGRARKNRILSS
jgi:hypothetical protein